MIRTAAINATTASFMNLRASVTCDSSACIGRGTEGGITSLTLDGFSRPVDHTHARACEKIDLSRLPFGALKPNASTPSAEVDFPGSSHFSME